MGQMTNNQQCQALKDNSWSVHQVKGHQSHQVKWNKYNFLNTYIAP